jgi:hypothetical protein
VKKNCWPSFLVIRHIAASRVARGWSEDACRQALGPKLDDRDLLPNVQPVGLDGHRHVAGIEAHRLLELEVRGVLVTVCRVLSRLLGSLM